ncbi:MAG: GNAT family N-acetyltransferase [Pseudomonadota bacterium]
MTNVRLARPSDISACVEIKNTWIDTTPWMPRVHPADDLPRHYGELFARTEVFVTGDPVAGFLVLDGNDVASLFCGETGRGHGRALLDHAKSRRDLLELWTFVANEGARRFYAREGFREVQRTEGDNEEALPDIRFRWTR